MRRRSGIIGPLLGVGLTALLLGACGSDPATVQDPIASLTSDVSHSGDVPAPAGLGDSAIPESSLEVQGPDGALSPQAWLTGLFPEGRDDVPITEVLLPGAHDAGTYGITCESELQLPGAKGVSAYEDLATGLEWNPLFLELTSQKKVLKEIRGLPEEECPVQSLAKAQADPTGGNRDGFINMLDGGIRFFDLRIYDNGAGPGGMDNFVFNHGPVISDARVRTALDNVLYFAASHPDELIILDLHQVTGHDPDFADADHDVDIPSLEKMLYENIYATGADYFAEQGIGGLCDLSISPDSMPRQGNPQARLADWTLKQMRASRAGTSDTINRNVLLMAQGGSQGGAAGDLINPNCIWDEDEILQQKWANSNEWSDILSTAYEQLELRQRAGQKGRFLLSQMQPTPAVPQYAECIGAGVLSPLSEAQTLISGESQACSLVQLTQDVTQPPNTYLPGWLDRDLRPNILFADWVLLPDKSFYPDIARANIRKFGLDQ